MKKSFFLFALSLLTIVSVQSQDTFATINTGAKIDLNKTLGNEISSIEMDENKFRKIEKEVIEKLQNEVKYPELALQFEVEGTVLLQFTFDGEIKELKVVKSVGAGCDKAAIKALENFPKLYQEFGGENVDEIKIIVPFRFEI